MANSFQTVGLAKKKLMAKLDQPKLKRPLVWRIILLLLIQVILFVPCSFLMGILLFFPLIIMVLAFPQAYMLIAYFAAPLFCSFALALGALSKMFAAEDAARL